MSRILDRELGAAGAAVRPRLPSLFEPGLLRLRTTGVGVAPGTVVPRPLTPGRPQPDAGEAGEHTEDRDAAGPQGAGTPWQSVDSCGPAPAGAAPAGQGRNESTPPSRQPRRQHVRPAPPGDGTPHDHSQAPPPDGPGSRSGTRRPGRGVDDGRDRRAVDAGRRSGDARPVGSDQRADARAPTPRERTAPQREGDPRSAAEPHPPRPAPLARTGDLPPVGAARHPASVRPVPPAPAPPVVRIAIGRIEVRAPAPDRPAPGNPRPAGRRTPRLGLADYLEQRDPGRRR